MAVEVHNKMFVHDVIGRVSPKSMNGKPKECLEEEIGIRHEKGDVYIVTYPKTGTTLLQYICHLLRTNGDDDNFDDIHQVVPHTSSSWFIGQNLNEKQRGSPRLFKSHRILDQVAPFAGGVKYIATIRDPTKTLISLHSFRMQRGQKQSSSIIEFAQSDIWTKENNPGCVLSIFDHFTQFWQARECENLLLIPYEDLVAHRDAWLPVIASFLGIVNVSDELFQKVYRRSSREHMLLNVHKFDESWTQKQRNVLGRVHQTIGTKSAAKVNSETAHSFTEQSTVKALDGRPVPSDGPITATVELNNVEAELKAMQESLWMQKVYPSTGLVSYAEMRRRVVLKHFPTGYSN